MRPLPFILAASEHSSLIVNTNDYNISTNGKYGIGHQILNYGHYEPEEIALVRGVLSDLRGVNGDGVVMLDCGANIGIHTIEAAKHMTQWGNVISFEPQERIFYALAGNVALNNCFNAIVKCAALGAECGIIDVPKPNYTKVGSFGSLELRHKEQTEFIGQSIDYTPANMDHVPLISIDSLELLRCDFIKMDVEGMEIEALSGAMRTIQCCRPTLLVEWIKCSFESLEAFFQPHNYKLQIYGGNVLATPEPQA